MASERICAVCAGDRFPPGEGWKPVFPSGFSERCELNPKQHPDISISTNARIFSNASRTLWICFPPIRAAAIMLKVDGVVDESTQRSPARSHLPDDSSSILNEFQVWTADAVDNAPKFSDDNQDPVSSPRATTLTSTFKTAMDSAWGTLCFDGANLMRRWTLGRWITARPGGGRPRDGYRLRECDPFAFWVPLHAAWSSVPASTDIDPDEAHQKPNVVAASALAASQAFDSYLTAVEAWRRQRAEWWRAKREARMKGCQSTGLGLPLGNSSCPFAVSKPSRTPSIDRVEWARGWAAGLCSSLRDAEIRVIGDDQGAAGAVFRAIVQALEAHQEHRFLDPVEVEIMKSRHILCGPINAFEENGSHPNRQSVRAPNQDDGMHQGPARHKDLELPCAGAVPRHRWAWPELSGKECRNSQEWNRCENEKENGTEREWEAMVCNGGTRIRLVHANDAKSLLMSAERVSMQDSRMTSSKRRNSVFGQRITFISYPLRVLSRHDPRIPVAPQLRSLTEETREAEAAACSSTRALLRETKADMGSRQGQEANRLYDEKHGQKCQLNTTFDGWTASAGLTHHSAVAWIGVEPLPLSAARSANYNRIVASINAALIRGVGAGGIAAQSSDDSKMKTFCYSGGEQSVDDAETENKDGAFDEPNVTAASLSAAFLDVTEMVADRPGCSSNGLHWGPAIQRSKAAALLDFAVRANVHARGEREAKGGRSRPSDRLREIRARAAAVEAARRQALEYWRQWDVLLKNAEKAPNASFFNASHANARRPKNDAAAQNSSDQRSIEIIDPVRDLDDGLRMDLNFSAATMTDDSTGLGNNVAEEKDSRINGTKSYNETLDRNQSKHTGRIRIRWVGRCGPITGGEPGYWAQVHPGSLPTYHLRDCVLRRFSRFDARQCLSGRHVLIMGDSVSRYQYLSLASLLHRSYPEGSGNGEATHGSVVLDDEEEEEDGESALGESDLEENDPDAVEENEDWSDGEAGRSNVCMPGLVWGSWRRFYLESSAGFEGRELCDCFRPEGPWDPDFERRVEENRFYSRPERQLLLSFIQVFGGFPVHGHFPGRCRGAGHGGKFRESCSPANITREELTEAGRVLEPDEYDSNPGMEADWSNYFDWTGDVPTVLERIVTHMNVNTLVLS
mmetsp:Transcript_76805/g.207027  ORF Transcript_76805/g.207027 Transcript_76805/m.207027 type:complete len:1138 (-) Transcript_76805:1607-5020(-)